MSLGIDVTISGGRKGLKRFRSGIADPAGLFEVHTRIAAEVKDYTSLYVASDEDHSTANRLGAEPTGHMAQMARRIEAEGDETRAVLKIPRKSRLRAAFGAFTITPNGGKKWLAIPAHRETYGIRAALYTKANLYFKIVGGRFPALCFKDGEFKGFVAYWLRRAVNVKEDRTLLPWDELPEIASRVVYEYCQELMEEGVTA